MALYTRKPVAVTAARTIPGTELKRIPDGLGAFVEYKPGDWILRFEDGHSEACSPATFEAEYESAEKADEAQEDAPEEAPLADLVPDPEAEDEGPVAATPEQLAPDGDPEEPA